MFEYETQKYSPTVYKKNNTDENKTSDALSVNNKLQEDSKQVAVSDAIKINFQSKSDENLGLINNNTFNMSLKGEVVKLEILNNNDKKSIETKEIKETVNKFKISPFENKEANVNIYYKLKVKNEGNIPGKVVKIGAYLSENENIVDGQRWIKERENFVTTRELENLELNPGEEKEIEVKVETTVQNALNKILDTKFEIIETSNNMGVKDINSVEGNNSTNEDDNINLDIVIVRDFNVIYITIIALIAAVGSAFRNKIIQILKKLKKEENIKNTGDKSMDETLRKEELDDKQK